MSKFPLFSKQLLKNILRNIMALYINYIIFSHVITFMVGIKNFYEPSTFETEFLQNISTVLTSSKNTTIYFFSHVHSIVLSLFQALSLLPSYAHIFANSSLLFFTSHWSELFFFFRMFWNSSTIKLSKMVLCGVFYTKFCFFYISERHTEKCRSKN